MSEGVDSEIILACLLQKQRIRSSCFADIDATSGAESGAGVKVLTQRCASGLGPSWMILDFMATSGLQSVRSACLISSAKSIRTLIEP